MVAEGAGYEAQVMKGCIFSLGDWRAAEIEAE
jgi:hypothetical protein